MKVLIVEDEDLLRRYLAGLEEWKALGCEVAGAARNGEEALKMAAELHPDLVLTDIRMPVMDGLELAAKLRESRPDLPIVLLSAYNDFEYAKQGIKLGVTDFLTKPVNLQELFEVVGAVRNGAGRANREEQLVKEHLVTTMLSEDVPPAEKKEALARERLEDKPLILLSVEIDNIELLHAMGKPLSQLSLRETVEHAVKSYPYVFWTYLWHRGVYVLLFRPSGEGWDMQSDCLRIAGDILERARGSFAFSASVGISSELSSLLELPRGVEEVDRCFDYRMLLGKQSIVSYPAIASLPTGADPWDEGRMAELELLLRRADASAIRNFLRSVYRDMLAKALNKSFIQRYALSMVDRTEAVLHEWSGKIDMPDFNEMRRKLLSFDVLVDLMKYLEAELTEAAGRIRGAAGGGETAVIGKVKRYIEEHYHEDISLASLARHLYLNPSYLSRLIKRETKMTFSELLWSHRIQEAKRKMIEEDAKTYEIAYNVGFKNAAHFSQMFKRIVGVTPGEYRRPVRRNPDERDGG